MSRKQQVVDLFRSNGELLDRLGVRRIGLFGAVVRKEDTAASDVDIFVEFTREGHTFFNFKAEHPEIERRPMARMRDKWIHHYFGVDYPLVWNTVTSDLPALRIQLASLVNR